MKTLLSILFLLICIKTSAQFDWIKSETERLAPNEWRILEWYSKVPNSLSVKVGNSVVTVTKGSGVFDYLEQGDFKSQLSAMSTNCHEINHGLTHMWGFMLLRDSSNYRRFSKLRDYKPLNPLYYYLLPNGSEFVTTTGVKFFPSKELVSEIPESLRTFRFKTYIDGTSSTQSSGILALLDEYNSYLHGYSFHYQMKEAYLATGKSELNGYINWRSSLWSDRGAYWEFNHYILEYLLLAKTDYPEIYNEFRGSEWGKIYNAVTENFWQLIKSHDLEIQSSISYWKSKGVDVSYRPGWEKFGILSTSTSDIEPILKPALLMSRYDVIRKELGLVNCSKLP